MQKIKAFLLVRDPSFIFYIHYPDLPFEKNIEIPEGNLEVCLAVPTSEVDKTEPGKESSEPIIDFGQFLIESAEEGLDEFSDLLVECPILVILEQEIESEIISKYKTWNNYIDKMNEQVECKEVVRKIDFETVEHDKPMPEFPKYCNGIVKVDTSKSIIYNQQIQGGVQ